MEWPAALEWHDELGSTSDRVKALARDGAPEWTVVLADVQAGGRGREGRRWVSPAGGLYLSVLLRPRSPQLSLLPLAAGVAVAEAAAELGVATELKWPNDVLVSGRKLAGILAEAASSPSGVEWVALGIGVNVAANASALSRAAAGHDRIARRGGRGSRAGRGRRGGAVRADRLVRCRSPSSPAAVVAAWRRRAVAWWGEPVEIRTGTETLRGRLLDVDDEGALLLAGPTGARGAWYPARSLRVRRAL